MESPLIEIKNLTKGFNHIPVLKNVSFKIPEGKITTIIGKSGDGKSVLLKNIIGLLIPEEGDILFKGRSLYRMTSKEKENYLGQLSYMFQNNALFDSLTVYDNIAMPLRYSSGLTRKEIDTKVRKQIEQVELTEAINKYPSELSGGMQKRVALARAMVTEAKLILFDEPTTGQDPARRNAILSMIADFQKKYHFTAVLISHDLPDVFFISDHILALYEGRIIFTGPPEDFEDFSHPFRDEFIRSLELLQEELTGLYSRRHFKVRYQTELDRNPQFRTYALIIFTINNLENIVNRLGYIVAQELLRRVGSFINRHFSEVGGFSTRHSFAQYTTVLPYSDQTEANQLLRVFTQDFRQHGAPELCEPVSVLPSSGTEDLGFSMLAGVAQGNPEMTLESTIDIAENHQKEIVKFQIQCGDE